MSRFKKILKLINKVLFQQSYYDLNTSNYILAVFLFIFSRFLTPLGGRTFRYSFTQRMAAIPRRELFYV